MLSWSLVWRAAFWLALIGVSVLSLLPVEQLPGPQLWDKASHVVAYFGLAALLNLAYPSLAGHRQFALLFVFGLGVELAQGATGYRHASFGDMLANGLGLLLFAALRPLLAGFIPEQ